jgi:hypothetical protein
MRSISLREAAGGRLFFDPGGYRNEGTAIILSQDKSLRQLSSRTSCMSFTNYAQGDR